MKETVNPVGWFEIYVENIDRARRFYETVLNREMFDLPMSEDLDEMKMVVFPMLDDAPNSSGALVEMRGVESGGNSTIVYFSCDNCEVEQSRVESAGGKILKPKFSIGDYGFISLVEDTEGNCIGLHSLK